MSKGLGIAALIIALISLVIPVVGIFTTWLALVLAAIGAVLGERTFAIVTAIIAFFGFLFLSPILWVAEAGAQGQGQSGYLIISFALCLLPIAGIIANAMGVGPKAA